MDTILIVYLDQSEYSLIIKKTISSNSMNFSRYLFLSFHSKNILGLADISLYYKHQKAKIGNLEVSHLHNSRRESPFRWRLVVRVGPFRLNIGQMN